MFEVCGSQGLLNDRAAPPRRDPGIRRGRLFEARRQGRGGTLAQLRALQTEVIEPAIAKHAGRLFKAVGDGFLVEFASAVQAVEAARAIQLANVDGKLSLRIGIHVGDVVVQGDDLMGDGVNIAARIEAVADAGGIALSRQAYDQVRDRLDIAFADKGEIE